MSKEGAMSSSSVQVLIVGAGPSGLTVAAELNRHGVQCRIIDQLPDAVSTSNALGVQARTLELWRDSGISGSAIENGIPVKQLNIHSGKRPIARFQFNRIDSPYAYMLALPQRDTESLLNEYLNDNGVVVERSVELIDFVHEDRHVKVMLRHEDGREETVLADWLIGCDGGRSFVREKLAVPFLGKDLEYHFVMMDTRIDGSLPKNEFHVFFSDKGTFAVIPLPDGISRIMADVTRDPKLYEEKSPSIQDFKRLSEERCGITLNFQESIWSSGFWVRERVVTQLVHDNVMLVGDAAHVHSPAGGQGMNTGIQDAYNLSWKLASVIHGSATPDLLKTYHEERHPIAKSVIVFSSLFLRIVTLHNRFLVALRNTIISWVSKIPFVANRLPRQMSEIDLHYRRSSIVSGSLIKRIQKRVWGLVGRQLLCAGDRAPDGPLKDEKGVNQSLFDLYQTTQHTVLIFLGQNPDLNVIAETSKHIQSQYCKYVNLCFVMPEDCDASELNEMGLPFFDQNMQVHRMFGALSSKVVLIRPDNYIGCLCSVTDITSLGQYFNGIFANLSHADASHIATEETRKAA